jgi:nucleoid-associated protein YgaU
MTGPGYIPVPAGDPIETEAPVPGSFLPGTLFLPTQQIPVPEVDDPESVTPQTVVPNEPTEVVVRAGDYMWSLAEQRLTQVLGRGVSDTEIAPYWLQVIGVNLSRIRSGDPDLIFPGEILLLPKIDL